MNATAILPVADRIGMTLEGLCRAVAGRIAGRMMAAAMIVMVWGRVRRIDREIRGLLQRFQAGRTRPVVARRSCGHGGRRGVRRVALPRRFGWLLEMVPGEAACFASQLRAQLAEPDMVALLAASPRAGRVLAPLCRMLGLERAVLGPWGSAVAATDGDAAGDVSSGGRGVLPLPPSPLPRPLRLGRVAETSRSSAGPPPRGPDVGS